MSDDLVKRLRDLGDHASFEPHMHHTAADRIEELEAKLAKVVVNLRIYAPSLVDGPEHDVGYYYGYHTALNRVLDLFEELKGQDDE